MKEDIEITTVEIVEDVLKIALTKQLKPVEWEGRKISSEKKKTDLKPVFSN